MTVEEYIKYRIGTIDPLIVFQKIFTKPFKTSSLRKFWWYWNPGYGYFSLFYCYKPLRNILPHWISLIITFLICGFLHDILYIIPMTIADGIGFIFPFISVWFLVIATGILITEFLQIDFRKTNIAIRPILHLGYLLGTFCLTRYLDLWIE